MMNARHTYCSALLLAALACFFPSFMHAEEKNGFTTHAFFKHIIGEWKSFGDLKNAEAQPVQVTEEWKAEAAGPNTLTIEGTRTINGDTRSYKWTITQNLATGIFEAELKADTNSPDSIRFELNVDEAAMKAELTGFLNAGGSKVILIDQFPEKDRDSFETKVTLTDENGTATLSGTLKNERTKKKP